MRGASTPSRVRIVGGSNGKRSSSSNRSDTDDRIDTLAQQQDVSITGGNNDTSTQHERT